MAAQFGKEYINPNEELEGVAAELRFEITDHLGSVRAVITGEKDAGTNRPNVVSLADYYPFGWALPGRQYTSSEGYRYGYQGSEKETEAYGSASMYSTYFRMLDVRLGRWFSPDPVTQPWQSPYNSMDNNPVSLTDVMGDRTPEGDGEKTYVYSNPPPKGLPPGDAPKSFNMGPIAGISAANDAIPQGCPNCAGTVNPSDGQVVSNSQGQQFRYNADEGAWNYQVVETVVEAEMLSWVEKRFLDFERGLSTHPAASIIGNSSGGPSIPFGPRRNCVFCPPDVDPGITAMVAPIWFTLGAVGGSQVLIPLVEGSVIAAPSIFNTTSAFVTTTATEVNLTVNYISTYAYSKIGYLYASGSIYIGQRLFLSNNFGITSRLFGSSAVGGSATQGLLNRSGSFLKIGWSTGVNNYGQWGYRFRFGIGSVGNKALFHGYLPGFVPNSFANSTIMLRQHLFQKAGYTKLHTFGL